MVFTPQNLSAASCCSSEDTCQTEPNKAEQKKAPCGSSTCDCICCFSVSLLPLEKDLSEATSSKDFHIPSFLYESLQGSLFHSMIWQPPRA